MVANVLHLSLGRQAGRLRCAAAIRFAFPVGHEAAALTYRDWLRQRLDRDMRGDAGYVRVQFMRRGLKGCGVVVEAELGDQAQDWFQIQENYTGVCSWLPGSKVRLCSGDGRCACEVEVAVGGGSGERSEHATPPFGVPPGNTGTTVRGEA